MGIDDEAARKLQADGMRNDPERGDWYGKPTPGIEGAPPTTTPGIQDVRAGKRPLIWLQGDEFEGVAECGCKLIAIGGPSMHLCPMHAAAPETTAQRDRLQTSLSKIALACHEELNGKPTKKWAPPHEVIKSIFAIATAAAEPKEPA